MKIAIARGIALSIVLAGMSVPVAARGPHHGMFGAPHHGHSINGWTGSRRLRLR
ncbi:hypothetical protein [Sphingomonas bacterium]|uniref:hypothetical protein n=1 Tax=Sphingomonas bacterium TaxID=1895847 RepID=UPI001575E1ED|nr:hypothetical protein [Sphingomonas bacterium]